MQQLLLSGRPPSDGGFRLAGLGQTAVQLVGSFCFTLFVLGVLVFTIIAATYHPADPLQQSSYSFRLTSFLTSTSTTSTSTFRSDDSAALRTGDDLLKPSSPLGGAADGIAIDLSDIASQLANGGGGCNADNAIDCSNREIFHLMMRAAIEAFQDVHFYRFGKPAPGGDDGASCDMAWHFRPKNAQRAGSYKDYRRFQVTRSLSDCSYSVVKIGDYHSGVNARKRQNQKGFGPKKGRDGSEQGAKFVEPVFGEAVNDSLQAALSENKFKRGKYLVYSGGGDRCKRMHHYLWSFLCALGEAQYLNRTLVMDLSICLSPNYTPTNQDEEGKDFRFYFDFEHLRDSVSVLEQQQFWKAWNLLQKKDKLSLHVVDDFRISPMKLAKVKSTLIMRKFGIVEPDNYWYRVCEGKTESVISRPWHVIWKSHRLMGIVSGIASRMNWNFDAVHIVRGDKAKNTQLWPNLGADTSPEALLSTLGEKIDQGRHLYIATNEPDTSFFNPLKNKYTIHFLDDFNNLWNEKSEWYSETKILNNGIPVRFDGYMRMVVDTEVFLRGKKQLETFNDLTTDCKNGINTCQFRVDDEAHIVSSLLSTCCCRSDQRDQRKPLKSRSKKAA